MTNDKFGGVIKLFVGKHPRMDEHRFLTIDTSGAGRSLIVSHIDRGDTVRIISTREVTRDEEKSYAEGNG